MMMLVKYLNYMINSIDGVKDSGLIMENNLIRKYQKSTKDQNPDVEQKYRKAIKH